MILGMVELMREVGEQVDEREGEERVLQKVKRWLGVCELMWCFFWLL